jgi:hypothetical protein
MNTNASDNTAKTHFPWSLDDQAEWETINYDRTNTGLL